MENPKPLATESFSYSWLVDIKPHSSRKPTDKDQSFDFNVSFTPSYVSLVHADELFADGHIMPVCVERFSNLSASVPPSPAYSFINHFAAAGAGSCSKEKHSSIGRWRKSSGRLWKKCFRLVKPLCRWPRKSIRVDDLDRKVCEVRSWGNSVQASPRTSSASKKCGRSEFSPRISPARTSSSTSWCGDESSINEAILYCKRSIEK